MGCNAWNHPAGCDCGWGGDTGGSEAVGGISASQVVSDGLTEFVRPNATCPLCGAQVFYYESSDGGKVWFDELGPPWPKHPCMDSVSVNIQSHDELLEFTGASLSPEKAMRMAAELIRYATSGFREDNRKWPTRDLLEARSEVIDWLYRGRESGVGHIVLPVELLQIAGYLEEEAEDDIATLALMISFNEIRSDDSGEQEPIVREDDMALFIDEANRARGTLRILSQLRAHYKRDNHSDPIKLEAVDK